MDARIIYACSQTYFDKVKWDRPTSVADSEWIYFGAGNELDLDMVKKTIEQHLQTDTFLLDVGRHRSRQVDR
jgi:hypothetical protein